MEKHRTSGFTLIEMLVVIAILGILASVVLNSVAGARAKAHQAKTEASLRSAQTTATYCMDSGNDLNTPDIANLICTGQGNWPAPVGAGWVYGDAGSCGFDGDVSDNDFLYCATNGITVITCTDTGCSTS
jgi:prepilin-type N-terminal cleavage/methylation domain-containing protein